MSSYGGCSKASCDFGALVEEVSMHPSLLNESCCVAEGRGSMCYASLEGEGNFGKNGYLYHYGLHSLFLCFIIFLLQ